jgi:hypothetical protein
MNSVQPGGIHPLPNVQTGGNGPVTGQETVIAVNFSTPFNLPADQYFFVPQVELTSGARIATCKAVSSESSLQPCIAVTGILGQFGLRNRSNRLLTQSFGISFPLLRKLNDLFG